MDAKEGARNTANRLSLLVVREKQGSEKGKKLGKSMKIDTTRSRTLREDKVDKIANPITGKNRRNTMKTNVFALAMCSRETFAVYLSHGAEERNRMEEEGKRGE